MEILLLPSLWPQVYLRSREWANAWTRDDKQAKNKRSKRVFPKIRTNGCSFSAVFNELTFALKDLGSYMGLQKESPSGVQTDRFEDHLSLLIIGSLTCQRFLQESNDA